MGDPWQPAAPIVHIRLRAQVLAAIRDFFAARDVLEVETPLLAAAPGTDVHLAPFVCQGHDGRKRYLQTSPELAMKRLLAAGSGNVYQICKAFRDGEAGRLHNPEFTLLEWYRLGWGPDELMSEIDDLLTTLTGRPAAHRTTYRELFARRLDVDPFEASTGRLRELALAAHGDVQGVAEDDRDTWLDLLFAELAKDLGHGRGLFVRDFPASQAALARIRPGSPKVAERFELFLDGFEIANGYHELTDPQEQRRRFESDLRERRQRNLLEVPMDEAFLASLEAGLPDCSGVALGLDRLLLVIAGEASLDRVLAFPWQRA